MQAVRSKTMRSRRAVGGAAGMQTAFEEQWCAALRLKRKKVQEEKQQQLGADGQLSGLFAGGGGSPYGGNSVCGRATEVVGELSPAVLHLRK